MGTDRALDCLQRPVLLPRRRQRQHTRGSARLGGEVGHQGGQIDVAVDRLQRGGHREAHV